MDRSYITAPTARDMFFPSTLGRPPSTVAVHPLSPVLLHLVDAKPVSGTSTSVSGINTGSLPISSVS